MKEITTQKDSLPVKSSDPFTAYVNNQHIQQMITNSIKTSRRELFKTEVIALYASDEGLRKCNPLSIIQAAITIEALGLPFAKSLGCAYVVPFYDKATFIIGWKGLMQLALRTKEYKDISISEIREGDIYRSNPITGKVQFSEEIYSENRETKPVVGYLASFELLSGFSKTLYMSKEKVLAHGKRYSKNFSNKSSLWQTDLDSMGKKTVLRQLITKYGLITTDLGDVIRAEEEEESIMYNAVEEKTIIFDTPEDANNMENNCIVGTLGNTDDIFN